jgi:hypothetical protein
MSEVTLDAWIRRGWATSYLRPHARLRVVRADPAEIERLRAMHQVSRGQHNRRPWPRLFQDRSGVGASRSRGGRDVPFCHDLISAWRT